jgi:histidinol-phosphatase
MIHSPELQAALEAAEKAAAIARSLYRRNIEIRIKADKSPVTEAYVRCELAIREVIEARFPEHGFYGEETGLHRQDAEYLWIVDPIDGTKAFVREYPMFSTQIALMHRGEIILGVSSAPIYGGQQHIHDRVGASVLRQYENSCHRCAVDPVRRDDCALEPHSRLRRFSALPSAVGG